MERYVLVRIHGRVQGVGFRAWVHHQAELRGLKGWVRNRRDSSVEALFAGSSTAIDGMLHACREGPRGSKVDRVETSEAEPEAVSNTFGVRDTL